MTTDEFPMVDVLRLRPLDGHRLWLRFTDGSEGVRDLSDLIAEGGVMVEPLKSKEYFDRVFVELGAPTWPNGFDLDPINLYMQLRKDRRFILLPFEPPALLGNFSLPNAVWFGTLAQVAAQGGVVPWGGFRCFSSP
jgi:hypothetical protein